MTTKKLASLFIFAGLLAACGDKDEGDTGATISTSFGTMTTTAGSESTGGGEGSGSAEGTTNGTTMTTADTSAEGPQDSSSDGGGCAPTDECQDDSDCNGGSCVACNCVGGEESSSGGVNPTMSDYGPCGACGPGEMPVSIMGFEEYCFCSPGCDGQGSMCATPNEGTAMPVCALELEPGVASQCALLCDPAMMGMCPTGAECIEVQMGTGVCMHPAP